MSSHTSYAPFSFEQYQYILRSALENGYEFISFPALQTCRQREERVCLLRHDCDNDLIAALAIAHLEAEMGIRSTYFLMLRSAMYNLLSIPNAKLAQEILSAGHWIGLHFDEQNYAQANLEQIAACVDRERCWLAEELGTQVDVVSVHQPTLRVLHNQIKLNCLNTYDRSDMDDAYYLSDSNMMWKEDNPIEFFRTRKHPRLQLLIHPEWWTKKEETLPQKWIGILRHNFELMQQSLLEREQTYNHSYHIEFYPSNSVYQGVKNERSH
jgi:hypothetical protein